MIWPFHLALGFLALAAVVQLVYILRKKRKRGQKLWSLGAILYVIGVYGMVVSGAFFPALRNGSLTAYGICLLSMALVIETLGDWTE